MFPDLLSFFKISKYKFVLQSQEQIVLPEYKGATFRGAFGVSLKKVSCAQKHSACNSCLLKGKCAYSFIFESSPVSSSEKLKNFEEIPRPFVIEPPATEKKHYATGEIFAFDLILIGKAIEYLPYIIYAFTELGRLGIGKFRGRFKVEKVVNERGDIIYDGKSEIINNRDSGVEVDIVRADIGERLKISFLTPTRIKYNGHYCDKPEFHIIIRTLLRRIFLLSHFYCDKMLDIDFKNLISRSYNVIIHKNNVRWVDWERYSSHQGTKMKLGGFVGDVVYGGDFKQFLPFLSFGEYLHIGKNCTFGLGKYIIT